MEALGIEEQQLLDEFLAGCDELVGRIDGMFPRGDAERRVKMRYAFYLAKGVSTFQAFAVLARSGYICEAELLNRANLELVIDAVYFHQSPLDRSLQLEEWLDASNWGLRPTNEEKREAAKSAKATFCTKYGYKEFPGHWSGVRTIAERAEQVGFEKEYKGHYRHQCDLSHCGTYAIASYLDYSQPDVVGIRTGPDWEQAPLAVSAACTWMWYCLRTVEEGLELSCYDLIHTLNERLLESGERIQMNAAEIADRLSASVLRQ